MKRNDASSATQGRGASSVVRASDSKRDHPQKNFADREGGLQPVAGAPKIAHPEDQSVFVDQCRFVRSWFKEMFERVDSEKKKSNREARNALQALLLLGVSELTTLALVNKQNTAQWAGKVLAIIDVYIGSLNEKLCKTNEAYRAKKATLGKLFRNDLWFPTDPLYRALHRELWYCSFYRGELIWPKAQKYLRDLPARMPDDYLAMMKLPKLSEKTWREWAKKLWPLVKKKNPHLLLQIQRHRQYKRVETRLSKYRKEFDQHLRALAIAETQGISAG